MNYYLLMRPLIGAGIGYVTNYIAVKMLFRPIKPIMIGNVKLPFTPGVIPKNKERIAVSIGEAISNHLLTEDEISKQLLSEEKKQMLYNAVKEKMHSMSSDVTFREGLLLVVPEETYASFREQSKAVVAKKIAMRMVEENAGKIIAEQIEKAVSEKVSGTMFSMLGIPSLVSNLSGDVANKINDYLKQHGEETVKSMLEKEYRTLEQEHLVDTIQKIDDAQIDIAQIVVAVYEKVIQEKMADLLQTVDIAKIVKERIDAMDMLELEALIMGIMKKELNALINLGAFIGLVLGCINLFL